MVEGLLDVVDYAADQVCSRPLRERPELLWIEDSLSDRREAETSGD